MIDTDISDTNIVDDLIPPKEEYYSDTLARDSVDDSDLSDDEKTISSNEGGTLDINTVDDQSFVGMPIHPGTDEGTA